MTLLEKLTADMAQSMKAGSADKTAVLRLLRGAVKNEEIKIGHDLNEDEALKVLQKEAKQRRDSMTAYREANRQDLVDQEAKELEIISAYLPEAMDDDQLAKVVDEVVAKTGANSPAQMGMVIGAVMKEVGARAEGGAVARLVREKLNS